MSCDGPVSVADQRLHARANLIVNVTEDILVEMEDQGISKAELAKKLGKSRSFVTQVLSGSRNLTLGSLADICFALGATPRLVIGAVSDGRPDSQLAEKIFHDAWLNIHVPQAKVVPFTQRKRVSEVFVPPAEDSNAGFGSISAYG